MPIRCTTCGHSMVYRDGAKFCSACAAPLPLVACSGCHKVNFTGDRFCTFCARALPGAPRSPHEAEVAEGGGPLDDTQELLALAEETRARAEAAANVPEPITKRHLDQSDIDRLFSDGPL